MPESDLKALYLFTTYLKFTVHVDDIEIYNYKGSSHYSLKSGGYTFHMIDLPKEINNPEIIIHFNSIIKEGNVDVFNLQPSIIGEPLNIFFTLLWESDLALIIFSVTTFILGVASLISSFLSQDDYRDNNFYRIGILSLIFSFYFIPQTLVTQFAFVDHRMLIHVIDYVSFNLIPIATFGIVRGKLSPKFNLLLNIFYHFSIGFLIFQIIMVLFFKIEFRIFLNFTLFIMMMMALTSLIFYFRTDAKEYPQKNQISKSLVLMIFLLLFITGGAFFTQKYFGAREFGGIFYLLLIVQMHIYAREYMMKQKESIKLEAYRDMALKDALTGLGSRFAYDNYLKMNKDEEFWVVSMDLNDLKMVNDTFGHSAGDKYITDTADLLREVLGDKADIFRVGGDEFIAFLKLPESENIEPLVGKLRDNISLDKDYFHKSIALGYAFYAATGEDELKEVLVMADKLMYYNKNFIKSKRKKSDKENPAFLNDF